LWSGAIQHGRGTWKKQPGEISIAELAKANVFGGRDLVPSYAVILDVFRVFKHGILSQ
jgi:hypothetical protein